MKPKVNRVMIYVDKISNFLNDYLVNLRNFKKINYISFDIKRSVTYK
jgi:hypothetical protein